MSLHCLFSFITSAKKVMFLPVFVCLFVCLYVSQQDNSKRYGRIFLKFWGYVGHGINYQWFSFGRDPAGILDSGLLWNFRYHCVKGGIKEPLAKRRWWRHLANSFALAEVPADYDCFLVCFEVRSGKPGLLLQPGRPIPVPKTGNAANHYYPLLCIAYYSVGYQIYIRF